MAFFRDALQECRLQKAFDTWISRFLNCSGEFKGSEQRQASYRSRCLEAATFFLFDVDSPETNGGTSELPGSSGHPATRVAEHTAFDLGGNSGRVIQFHTDTGDVLLKRLSTWDSQQRKLLAELAS